MQNWTLYLGDCAEQLQHIASDSLFRCTQGPIEREVWAGRMTSMATADLVVKRNTHIVALIDLILIALVEKGGKTEALCKKVLADMT